MPPGVAYTTGFSHNPFTFTPPIGREGNHYAKSNATYTCLILCKTVASFTVENDSVNSHMYSYIFIHG